MSVQRQVHFVGDSAECQRKQWKIHTSKTKLFFSEDLNEEAVTTVKDLIQPALRDLRTYIEQVVLVPPELRVLLQH